MELINSKSKKQNKDFQKLVFKLSTKLFKIRRLIIPLFIAIFVYGIIHLSIDIFVLSKYLINLLTNI